MLEELHKKGVKFEQIANIKIIKGREIYSRGYIDENHLIPIYDPIVANKFNNEVIIKGSSHIYNEVLEEQPDAGSEGMTGPYTILFKPQHSGEINISIRRAFWNEDDKHFYVENHLWIKPKKFSLYDSNVLKNKGNEIRKKLLELIEKELNEGF